jgi:hypothetical protein
MPGLLGRAGLKLENIRFASPEHDPYGWVQSLLNRMGFRQNNLTRFLMKIDKISPALMLQIVLAVLLTPLALLAAGLSWLCGSGAIMEARAVRSK